jgi:hypothetical protein
MSSVSKITAAFSELVSALRTHQQATFDALENAGTGDWFDPGADDPIDLRDPASIAAAFDRSEVSDLLVGLLAAPAAATQGSGASVPRGAVMDLAAIQSQLEFMQAVERCYMSATMNPLRATAHAAARDEAHAVAGGVLDRGIAAYAADLNKRAGEAAQV